MTSRTVARRPVAEDLSRILESPEVTRLTDELQATRWTGRPGYPIRSMIGMALAKSLYAISTWTRTVALVREHTPLAAVIAPDGDVPSVYACYRFTAKLREHHDILEACIAGVIAALKKQNPLLGWDIAIDASDMPHETLFVAPLLDKLHARGISPQTCAMDKGYDVPRVYDECEDRDCHPVTPLIQTATIKRGAHKPPCCKHGEWRFAGADNKRKATKWRCPTGECKPASTWIKASKLHPLIPRETPRWKALYRRRASVERQFGRLKHEWALAPLRVRKIERVRLHADLTILSQLSTALSRERGDVALAA